MKKQSTVSRVGILTVMAALLMSYSFKLDPLGPEGGVFSDSSRLQPQSQSQAMPLPLEALASGFKSIPDSIQTSVYWYWISDNISKRGVTEDLQAMKKAGINRAFIGNIGLNDVPYGKVKLFSKQWWDILHTALKTATALNIEIGIFNGPGWSQSGGPWIKPEQSMRYLTASNTSVCVQAGKSIDMQLKRPAADFQDVRVLAVPAPKDYHKSLQQLGATITTTPEVPAAALLSDGDTTASVAFAKDSVFLINIDFKQPFTARSVVLYPADQRMVLQGVIQAKLNGSSTYRTLTSFRVDRSNDALNVGFLPYAPGAISIPATTASQFRIRFDHVAENNGLKELKLSGTPVVADYAEKTLAKMYPTPLPYWTAYQWPVQPVVNDKASLINPAQVLDVSRFMQPDGHFKWTAPKGTGTGSWIIMRLGMVPTRVQNSPAAPEGTGLEVDKMSKQHVRAHFDAFLGEILKRIPAEDRKTFKVTVEDSYETGGQNWTDNMIPNFKKAYGYDPTPYLPVLQGMVVGSEDASDRFLWDLRRFIAHEVAYKYVAGLREVSHEHGLHTWLENYGHWGFPAEFLQYGGQSDEVGGEFWSEGDLGNIENRAASSAAHIYGKTKVSAESFTAGGRAYQRYPGIIKQRGDRFFTEGINNTLLHLFIQQPDDTKVPGVNAGFGTEFNRLNTWFRDLDLFTDYLKRCNLMLQQGKYVADVAYFIGEDAPKMTGVCDPALPFGYAFDYINAEVIENRLQVKNGKLVLPDGMSYRILVLPKLETMRPGLLKKIGELVKEGAVVLGPRPTRSPSLSGYPKADGQIQRLSAKIWGDADGVTNKIHRYGKGMMLNGMNMQEALDLLKITPDYTADSQDGTLFIHRKVDSADIYFVSNQTHKKVSIQPAFRVKGKAPELWNPVNGSMRGLPAYHEKGNSTTVALTLAPLESAFVVFRKEAKKTTSPQQVNFPEPNLLETIKTPWKVVFDTSRWGPVAPVEFNQLVDWTKRPEDAIKYYSGTAVYHNHFKMTRRHSKRRILLDIGRVVAMAKIKVNGKYVGGLWTAPYQIDITDAVKSGDNELEIAVTNTWVNRLVGDSKLPADKRHTWTSTPLYNPDSPLEVSGLLGPVTIKEVVYAP